MSIARKVALRAEAIKGDVRKAVGRATGHRRPPAHGRGDQITRNLKQAGARIKVAVRHWTGRLARR
jgi:uncharacterized protein YjbJ (UPF0337 family)